MSGTLTIHRTYFLESDIHDGDYPHDDVRTEVYPDLDLYETVDELRKTGLTFESTGGAWAADPDGSYIVDYGIGKRCETSGHLDGYSPNEVAYITEHTDVRP